MDIFASQNRKLLWALILLFGTIMLLLGVLVGMVVDLGAEKSNEYVLTLPAPTAEPVQEPPAAQVDHIGEASVLPDTRVTVVCEFTKCGHKLERDCGSAYVGLTREEIRAACPEWELTEFSKEAVTFAQTCDFCCPEHYYLALVGDELQISQTHPETLEQLPLICSGIDAADLTPEAAEALRAGMCFDDLSEIDAYLENAES